MTTIRSSASAARLHPVVEFGKKLRHRFDCVGREGHSVPRLHRSDRRGVQPDLKAAKLLTCHTDPSALREADFVIVAVPARSMSVSQTLPVKSSSTVGKHLKRGAIVVYESTVLPWCDKGSLYPDSGEAFRYEMETGL